MQVSLHKVLTVLMLGMFPAMASAESGRDPAHNHVNKHSRSRLRSRGRFGVLQTLSLALAIAALVHTSEVQAQVQPNAKLPGPHSIGYLVYTKTNNKPSAGTDSTIFMSLTFFAPGYHQMYWVLDNPNTNDLERGSVDSFFFDDAYIPRPGNKPYLSLRSDGAGNSPDWLWDTICVYYIEGGIANDSKSWTWTNPSKTPIEGAPQHREWYNFGIGSDIPCHDR
jgi:hypothetical protein